MALQPGNTSFVPGDLLTAQQYNITHNTVNKLAIEDNSRVVYPGSFPPANIASGHWVIAALAGNYSNYPGITSTSVLSPSVLVYDSSINEWDVYPLTGASDSTIGIYNPSVQYKINDIVIYSDLDSVLPEYRHEYIYRCNEIAFPDQSPESNPSKWVRQGLYIDTDAITALITSLDSRLTSAEIELTNKVNTSLLGANNGVATLDNQGKILTSQLPSLLINNTYVVNSEAEMLALLATKSDIVVRTDIEKTFILAEEPASNINNWVEVLASYDRVISVNGLGGIVTLTTSNIPEGSNLYFSDLRVNNNTNVAANTSKRHDQVTIGTPNGLLLTGQELSLQKASITETGALSSEDWLTFNNKQDIILQGPIDSYYRGDKTWQTLNTASVLETTNLYFTQSRVLNTSIGNFIEIDVAITAGDSIATALNKLQTQVNKRIATVEHDSLTPESRALPEQHPIGAITGLSTSLSDLSDAISLEEFNRQQGDSALALTISTETSNRESADLAITNSIFAIETEIDKLYTESDTEPLSPNEGDEWLNTVTGILYKWYTNPDNSGTWVSWSSGGGNGEGGYVPQPVANYIEFVSTGATFAPEIVLNGAALATWRFDDGTESTSLTPNKDYRCAAPRTNRLTVTPWSALVGINLGYNRQDGGWYNVGAYPMNARAVTPVTEVNNLSLAKDSLLFFCGSDNFIRELDFTNFSVLQDIECYNIPLLVSVKTKGCSALRRGCFENCSISSLDLTDSPLFEDLRAAGIPELLNVTYGGPKPHQWHICHRANPNFQNRYIYEDLTSRPNITDLWIHDLNQYGNLVVPSSGAGFSLWGYNNHWSSANFQGAMTSAAASCSINFTNTPITALNITGCVGLININCTNTNLPTANVDSILAELVTLGRSNGTVIINGAGNEGPSMAGEASAAILTSRGWTVTLNVATQTFTITASAGANGTVSPLGAQTVNSGSNQTFNFAPANGYNIQEVLVDGVSQGAISSYTFLNITANHTVSVSFVEAINQVATPVITPAAGTYNTAQSIAITCATGGATIHYTTDGSVPTPSSPVYSGVVNVSADTTIRAIAVAAGMTDSEVANAAYTIQAVSTNTVTVSRNSNKTLEIRIGTMTPGQTVSIDWQDGSPVEQVNLTVQSNLSTGQIITHGYSTSGPNTAVVTLSENITYFGVSEGGGYYGDWNNLKYCISLSYIFFFNNNFSFDFTGWRSLTNLRQCHFASNPQMTSAQISTCLVELNMASPSGVSGASFYSPVLRANLTAEGVAAWDSLQTKGWSMNALT